MSEQCAVIIPAAGSGSRMRSKVPKQYLRLAGRPVLVHTVSAFSSHPEIDSIIVVAPPDQVHATRDLLANYGLASHCEVIAGGARRQDSVLNGLHYLAESVDIVLVHDGARPLVSRRIISECLQGARDSGAAIVAIEVKDTLKRADQKMMIAGTIDREGLWRAQTPQGARRSQLLHAFELTGQDDVTDEAMLLEKAGYPVQVVAGSERNIKITRQEDLAIAEAMLMQMKDVFRIGHGYDAHRFAVDRELVLGGVAIQNDRGLVGHSDADVVTHALCDAILGAMGEGDIGSHFPDSSEAFKDIYSIRLLEKVAELMGKKGYSFGNGDITVVCQRPKLAPYVEQMREILTRAIGVELGRMNIKATTTERMGFTGREEGISCYAVVILTGEPS